MAEKELSKDQIKDQIGGWLPFFTGKSIKQCIEYFKSKESSEGEHVSAAEEAAFYEYLDGQMLGLGDWSEIQDLKVKAETSGDQALIRIFRALNAQSGKTYGPIGPKFQDPNKKKDGE